MKKACLHFLMISCALLAPATACADSARPASRQSPPGNAANSVSNHPYGAGLAASPESGKDQKIVSPSGERLDHRQVSEKNHAPSRTPVASHHPKQTPNNQEHWLSGNAINVRQPGSDKRRAVAKSGLIQRHTVNSALPVRSANSIGPTAPVRNNVRHRGENPAVISGSANSVVRNTGAINGTSVHRRP